MTGIKTDANAGLVFDTVNDALQFLKTTSHCVALARHVLHHCTGQKFTVNSIRVYVSFSKEKFPEAIGNSLIFSISDQSKWFLSV